MMTTTTTSAAAAASPRGLCYVSTRGGPRRYSFKEAVLAGWADDGGMLLPDRIPTLSPATLASWRTLSYPKLVAAFLRLYIDPTDNLPIDDIVARSFSGFASPEVIELAPIDLSPFLTGQDDHDRKIHVAELFHGPSLAFKDLGMQVLANILEHYLQEAERPMTFLVGTSGDTGPSALAAVAGKARMRLLVLYPKGRVSPTQEAQMLAHATATSAPNVRVVAVEGTSDDLDEPIAEVFQDEAYRKAHHLGSLNSVNVVRLLVQVAHYFHCYLQLANPTISPPQNTRFIVPTGAAGHVTAGVIACLMGLPVEGLVMATNENDILHHMMGSGALQKKASVVPTNSPAMDIQAPYNIERILHLLARPPDAQEAAPVIGGKGIRALMDTFYRGEPMVIPPAIMERLKALGVQSTAVGRDAVLRTIREVYATPTNNLYILDPHTAIGVSAAATITPTPTTPSPTPVVCMGCAHPAKFTETVQAALGLSSEAEGARAIRAWAKYPAAGATLELVARLKGEGGGEGVPVFRWADRAQWRALLEEEIGRLEAAVP